jgi:hypothetical protein
MNRNLVGSKRLLILDLLTNMASADNLDTSFHQPLPNMVQRLFADVINDAIWFMNIHEQNHP